MLGTVQRGAISRLLTKINEAEAMMNQVCLCTECPVHRAMSNTVHVCIVHCQLRKRYESAVEERNSHGLSLIERNEELSIFYEKLNLQGTYVCCAHHNVQWCREEGFQGFMETLFSCKGQLLY